MSNYKAMGSNGVVVQVVSLVSDSEAKGTLAEVSGPADPLQVAIAHVVDVEEGTLSLRIALSNRLPAEVKNIVVRCGLPTIMPAWGALLHMLAATCHRVQT